MPWLGELVLIQILAKCEACELYPCWYRDLEEYKLVVKHIANRVREVSEWASQLIERARFLEKVDAASSIHDIIRACYEVWKESEGILDLCP